MEKQLKEVREKMAKLLADMRGILDKAGAEQRDMTTDEETQYDAMERDYDKLEKQEERLVKAIEREKKANETRSGKPPVTDPNGDGKKRDGADDAEIRMRAFNGFLRGGVAGVPPEAMVAFRALQADSDTGGGYIVAPQQFVADLIKDIDNDVIVRQLATVHTLTKAESMGAPSLDNDPDDADWTSEIGTVSEDSTMSFGKRELFPHPLSKLAKVSRRLLRIGALNADALVRQRLTYKFSVTHENAFLNGSGANRPLGVFVASSDGISTSRDVSTGNTTTSIKVDGLIEALYSLKEGYMRNATWIFHRDAVKQIRKLKDGDGQYIWQPGLASDRPNTILDRPYRMSEYAPNTFTTGQYVGIIGDFKYYWIADALSMEIQRLDELYAEKNQVGFIGRLETDGMPVLENAFARVKLA